MQILVTIADPCPTPTPTPTATPSPSPSPTATPPPPACGLDGDYCGVYPYNCCSGYHCNTLDGINQCVADSTCADHFGQTRRATWSVLKVGSVPSARRGAGLGANASVPPRPSSLT
ncbi:MAG: hypothetical protein DMF64_11110 [Acidobacteria bacterium]|nr:MAG: hypothetical protein DMF64_11110 [Acidobacteriota bacterium]